MRLTYFSPVPWASFRQRPHEFVEWFQRRFAAEVLWVEPYPVRLPRAEDLRRPRVAATAPADVPRWLQRVRPLALPLEPLALGRRLNGLIAWPRVRREIEAFAGGGDMVLAIGKPSDLALRALREFGRCPSLYDAMDDFSAFQQGMARSTAARIERDIERGVTWRSTSSSRIAARMRAQGLQAQIVPNGVASERLPASGAGNPAGPFGYVGTIASWFDWDWVCALAADWPDRPVAIHGPVYRAPPRALPPNVQLLPALPHEQALLRMREFCAGLVPFLRNELTDSVDPVKYYEYRALGLPVLATPFGELRERGDDPRVLLTERPQDAHDAIAGLVAQRDAAESVAAFRARHDWAASFEPLARLIP